MDGVCSMHGRDEKCYVILVWNPERKRPLGRQIRWAKISEFILGKWGGTWELDSAGSGWRASVNAVMNLRVPLRKRDFFWQAEWQSAFQIISCTME